MHQGSRGLTATERWTLRIAPAFGIATVLASALAFTEPEARWALIYAGPTDQPGRHSPGAQQPEALAWRIAVMSDSPGLARGAATEGHLLLSFGAANTTRIPFRTDADGIAWVTIERPAVSNGGAPIETVVFERDRQLARGSVHVPLTRWAASKRTDGGWCTGFHEGPVEIRLGIIDGVLLHGYPSAALVTLQEGGRPLANQPLLLEADGATFVGAAKGSSVMLVSDTRGMAHFQLQSSDMAATLTIMVPEPRRSRLTASLPLRAGGLRAFRSNDRLIVSSHVPTRKAWLGLLTEHGLSRVQALNLEASGENWSATTTVDSWPKPPLWAVVSAEPELDSVNTLGWPLLDESEHDRAHTILVAPNVLALDGRQHVLRRLAKQRERAIVTSSIALLVVAALVTGVVLRANRRHQQQVRHLARLVENGSAPPLADGTPLALIAVVVTTAALIALALWFTL